MAHELLLAGFGGQGVMSMGMIITYAGMIEGKRVSWIPSYGPEQRGGTANCSVVVSDRAIGSPVVTEPDTLVAMNLPSLDRFEQAVKPGGIIVVNTSLIERKVARTDVQVVEIDATALADEMGNQRIANMIVLGAVIGLTRVVGMDAVKKSLYKVFPPHRHNLIPANEMALDKGFGLAQAAPGA